MDSNGTTTKQMILRQHPRSFLPHMLPLNPINASIYSININELASPVFGPLSSLPIVYQIYLLILHPSTYERRRSYIIRNYKYGSSHNPVKKSFPSNYYQSTVGDRTSVQPVFVDHSVSLGIRKTSTDEIRPES